MTAKECEQAAEQLLTGISEMSKGANGGTTIDQIAPQLQLMAQTANAYAQLAVSKRIGEYRHWAGAVYDAQRSLHP